ncbi:hypothetical protein [Absidia glauca]|uniref:Uncharacterized protein n=1 Tax=Absidia glauca TaxID=4829 RepID=A0A163IVQ0_ABSGL|nr:hypothetical protein [Absidia glauca]
MTDQTTPLTASSPSLPVTVSYIEDNPSTWTEIGTGFCDYLINGDKPDELVVRSGLHSTPLVSTFVFPEETYHNYQKFCGELNLKQTPLLVEYLQEGFTNLLYNAILIGESIIWNHLGTDEFVLNFGDRKSRDAIWHHICNKRNQGGFINRDAAATITHDDSDSDSDEQFEDAATITHDDFDSDSDDQFEDAATTIDPDNSTHDDSSSAYNLDCPIGAREPRPSQHDENPGNKRKRDHDDDEEDDGRAPKRR